MYIEHKPIRTRGNLQVT